jgi:hypothetical protein
LDLAAKMSDTGGMMRRLPITFLAAGILLAPPAQAGSPNKSVEAGIKTPVQPRLKPSLTADVLNGTYS